MQKLTQSHSDNCWQTCIAMLLGCAAEDLPDQHAMGHDPVKYGHALRAFLYKHYAMAYIEVGPEMFSEVARQGIAHVIIGESPRTTSENDTWHAIVGVAGEPYWDVNPSRAGLTKVIKYGVLAPFPETWQAEWKRREASGSGETVCVCPKCFSA